MSHFAYLSGNASAFTFLTFSFYSKKVLLRTNLIVPLVRSPSLKGWQCWQSLTSIYCDKLEQESCKLTTMVIQMARIIFIKIHHSIVEDLIVETCFVYSKFPINTLLGGLRNT